MSDTYVIGMSLITVLLLIARKKYKIEKHFDIR